MNDKTTMTASLLSTKLRVPPRRQNAVSRPRLVSRLLSSLGQPGRFVLLSGPAGFGKTTLLSEFVTELQKPVAWVSLDAGDNDPIQFWTYLINAIQFVQPDAGQAALAMLQSPQPFPAEIIPTLLINDLSGSPDDIVLILDDYHSIQNTSLHDAMAFLLDHLPDNLDPVVSTRMDPPWPLARFRARDQVVEIRSADLRFTAEESVLFLDQVMDLHLSTENVAALESRTEGWIASLQLAALSMKGRRDITGFIQSFTGSHVYVAEYLMDEVLGRQSQDVTYFLLRTSILERLHADLCEAVSTQSDGQTILRNLNQANLFIIPLDDEGQWYRYHRLFADLLRARLQQSFPAAEIKALHRRAAIWYEQAGMMNEALEHLLAAADYTEAVMLLERIAPQLILKAYFKTVEDWLQAIPPQFRQGSARLNMSLAWMYLMRRDPLQAGPYIEQLQVLFSDSQAAAKHAALQGEWLALQSILLGAQGKVTESRDAAEQALNCLPEDQVQVRIMTFMGLANAYRQMLEYERAAQAAEAMIRESHQAGDLASEIFGLSFQGLIVLQEGRLHSAFEVATRGLRLGERSGLFSPFSATLHGELAQIYYHWHRLEEARGYFERSVQWSLPGGFSDAQIYNCVFLSRLFQMEGRLQESVEEIEKALDLMQTAAPSLVGEEVIAQQVSIFLALDRLAEAKAALSPYGFSFERGFFYPALGSNALLSHPQGLLYNSALRILLHPDRKIPEKLLMKQGIELAALVLRGSFRTRHLPIALQTLLLRAQLYTALGEDQKGLADVIRALELAEPEGFISLFLEEGQPVAELLAALLKCRMPGNVKAGYVQQILTAFPKTQSVGTVPGRAVDRDLSPIEPLTPRELEVLQLIAAGDSNQAIADKLVITLSAVKKHTGNIFNKLSVHSRTQAVARARLLGLLPTEN